MLTPALRLVHLQLTKRCNLRCSFCGQWGEKGYLRNREMPPEADGEEWHRIVDELAALIPKPRIVLWGGEPLLHPAFIGILHHIRDSGFEVDLITNGTLLEPFLNDIHECVNTIYVSLDGPKRVHDRVRGVDGIFDQILANLQKIDRNRVQKVVMTYINEQNYETLPDFPNLLEPADISKLLIQNLIFLTPEEIDRYREWLRSRFGVCSCTAEAWRWEGSPGFTERLPQVVREIRRRQAAGGYPVAVNLFPDVTEEDIVAHYCASTGLPSMKSIDAYCCVPFRHVNVAPNGDVQLCVDFHDFTVGNCRRTAVADLFMSEEADAFRHEVALGRNPSCTRCPWRHNTALGS